MLNHNSTHQNPRMCSFRALAILMACICGLGALVGSGLLGASTREGTSTSATNTPAPRPAMLPSAPPIIINEAVPGQRWTDCPWVNGSGTLQEPYVIQYLDIDASSAGDCISILDSGDHYFRIQHCVLHHGVDYGIYLNTVTMGTIRNNTILDGDWGIYLESAAKNNTLVGNNCTGNYHGIWLEAASNNTLTSNYCTGSNYDGIYLNVANNNTISGNNCSGNNQNGVYINQASNNTLTGNTCSDNQGEGIAVNAANNNTFTRNTFSGNLANGILLSVANNNTLTGNTCSENIVNIYLDISCNNTITGNNCSGSLDEGIYLTTGSDNNTISANYLQGNIKCGIYIDAKGNHVTGNVLSRNADGGIILFTASESNVVTGNWFKDPNTILDSGTGNIVTPNYVVYKPVANFTLNPTLPLTGQDVQFTDATSSGLSPLSYQWDFGDGTTNSTAQNPTHKYGATGTYIVTLTVRDADGDLSVHTMSLTVNAGIVNTGIAGYDGFVLLGVTSIALAIAIIARRKHMQF